MKQRLQHKLTQLREDLDCGAFILADAKDADMVFGVASPGLAYPTRDGSSRYRSMADLRAQIREIVNQGLIDIMLASTSTMSILGHRERLFVESDVTPAIRANDTTDLWLVRGAEYPQVAARPFATSFIREVQHGDLTTAPANAPLINLGLFSMTFNNDVEHDAAQLAAFRAFRAEAAQCGFPYFIEVFAPNVPGAVPEAEVAGFLNDHICRMLAGVPVQARPEFLKIPYFGPGALEELVNYDAQMLVGILGGGSGTTMDAFKLLSEARRHGARAALFGRKIKDAEHPLTFVRYLRAVADDAIQPQEAVKAYHDDLRKQDIPPRHCLADDLELTACELAYAR